MTCNSSHDEQVWTMCFGACPNEVWYAPDASASSIFVPFFASALSGADGKPSALHWSSSQFHIEFSSVAKMCSKCQSMSEHSGTEIDWSECVCVCVCVWGGVRLVSVRKRAPQHKTWNVFFMMDLFQIVHVWASKVFQGSMLLLTVLARWRASALLPKTRFRPRGGRMSLACLRTL